MSFFFFFFCFFYRAFSTLYEFEPPHSRVSEITHIDTRQSVGLLWTGDQPVAETSTWQRIQHPQRTNIHDPVGIRTRNPCKRSAVDTRLRPLGNWDNAVSLSDKMQGNDNCVYTHCNVSCSFVSSTILRSVSFIVFLNMADVTICPVGCRFRTP